MSKLCLLVNKLDTVTCHADVTKRSIPHQLTFGHHGFEFVAVCGMFVLVVNLSSSLALNAEFSSICFTLCRNNCNFLSSVGLYCTARTFKRNSAERLEELLSISRLPSENLF